MISTSIPEYDASGRMVGMKREGEGEGNASIQAQMSYDVFGKIARHEEPSGTITRNVYDELGRLEHVYRGTKDQHEAWNNAPEDPNQDPNNYCDLQFINDDNLVLIEKRYYGRTVTDAGELTHVRSFRDMPLNQYVEVVPGFCQGPPYNVPPPPENNEDTIGWVTEYQYDWRMRPVVSIRRDAGANGPSLTHTYSWYDNLDRVRLTAEYGAEAPTGSVDPRQLGPNDNVPTAAQILGVAPAPISLVENTYNLRGLAEEVRRYQFIPGNPPDIGSTATRTYYDHADRAVEVHSPGAPVQRTVFDAKGRQILSLAMVGVTEVTRTKTVYDDNDRATEVTHYERTHNATGPTLDSSKAILTYRHTWYDHAGRVIATADYGTNNTTFVNGTAPTYGAAPPACGSTGPLVTAYEYDEAGRQSTVTHPDCSVTKYEYDDLGRMVMMIENFAASSENDRRVTAYQFDNQGRLVKSAAVLPGHNGGVTSYSQVQWGIGNATLQETQLVYGADVIPSSGGVPISKNNDWVATVRYPNPQTGQPSPIDILQFSYYSDGLVATRTDALDRTFVYIYDELGRRIETRFEPPTVACPDPPEGECTYHKGIRRIAYEYEPDGLLALVTAYAPDEENEEIVVAQNQFEYNELRHLTADWQAHGGLVDEFSTPVTNYDWDFSPLPSDDPPVIGYNFDRLKSITYPERPQDATRRTVTLKYGMSPGDLDSSLSRVTKIHDDLLSADVSTYTYMGTSRRVSNTLANLVSQTFVGGGGYSGLDPYGRVIDLNYTKINGTVYRYQYGYDAMGNRLYARITQRSTNGVLHLNDRSHLYAYDGLQRLVTADTGKLNTNNNALQSGTLILGVDWTLDNLGNWSGDIAAPYESVVRTGNFDQDPALETIAINHDVDAANRLESVTTDGTSVTVQTDRAGNVIHDGNHVQRYDAWNRLLEVYEPGTAVLDDYGVVTDGELGDRVAAYSYDGIGRLIRIERMQDDQPVTIDLYYDGVRRIQEVLTTDDGEGGQQMMAGGGGGGLSEPITQVMGLTPGPEDYGMPAAGGEPAALDLAEATPPPPNPPGGEVDPEAPDAAIRLDASSTAVSEPLTPSQGSVPGEGSIPGGGPEPLGGGAMSMSGQTIVAEREYIWGPDYVDECVVQLDENNTPYYVIQDANYNVIALLDATGLPVVQYTYEPYGALQLAESFAQHPVNRLGHQGLFFERFDAGPYDPALVPGGRGLYNARNRLYEPITARWTSKDPNATAAPILEALAMNGTSLGAWMGNVDIRSQYADGMNLYQYVGSNPVNNRDPLGLYDWFAGIDELMGSIYAERAAAGAALTSSISTGLNLAGLVGRMAVSMLPGGDALLLIGKLASGSKITWDDWLSAGLSVGGGALIGKLAGKLMKTLKNYGSKGDEALGLLRRDLSLPVMQACFAGDTLVWMADGSFVPISEVSPGSEVMCDADPRADDGPESCEVLLLSRRTVDETHTLVVASAGATTAIQATPEHPFYVPDRMGYVRAKDLTVGTVFTSGLGEPSVLIDAVTHREPTEVFNLSISLAHNFYVSERSVLVHNAQCFIEISKVAPDWLTKGAHVHVNGIELAVKPGNGGTVVLKPVFSGDAGKSGGAIAAAYEALADSGFRGQMSAAVQRGFEYAHGAGKHDKAFEFKMLLIALEKMGN